MKLLILTILLLIACVTDLKYRKIPNSLIVIGLITGFLFQPSFKAVVMQVLAIIFLFFLGMLRIMGMGDLKLWMVMTVYLGLGTSSILMAISACLLIVYGLLVNTDESKLILNHMKFSILLKRIPVTMEQTSYPFAPFIFVSYLLYIVWRCLF